MSSWVNVKVVHADESFLVLQYFNKYPRVTNATKTEIPETRRLITIILGVITALREIPGVTGPVKVLDSVPISLPSQTPSHSPLRCPNVPSLNYQRGMPSPYHLRRQDLHRLALFSSTPAVALRWQHLTEGRTHKATTQTFKMWFGLGWVTASPKAGDSTTSVRFRGIVWSPEDHSIPDPVNNPIPELSNKPNIYLPTQLLKAISSPPTRFIKTS